MTFLHKWDGEFTSLLARNSLIGGFAFAAHSHKGINTGLVIDQNFKYNYPKIKNLTHPVALPWLNKLIKPKNGLFTFYNNSTRPSYFIPDAIKVFNNIPMSCFYKDLANIRSLLINRNEPFSSASNQLLSRYQIEKMFVLLNSNLTPVAAKVKILSRFEFEANLNERDIQRLRKDYNYDFGGIQRAFIQMDKEKLKLIPDKVVLYSNYALIVPDFLKKSFMNYALERIDNQYSHARYAFIDEIFQEAINLFNTLSKKDKIYRNLFREWIQLNIEMLVKKTSLSSELYKEYVSPLEGILCSYYARPPQNPEEKEKTIKDINDILSSKGETISTFVGTLTQYISIAESVLGWTDISEQEAYGIPFVLTGKEKDIV